MTTPIIEADDELWHALHEAGVRGHEVTIMRGRFESDAGRGPAHLVVVVHDDTGRWAGSPLVASAAARVLATAIPQSTTTIAELWNAGMLVATRWCVRCEPGDADGAGYFTDWSADWSEPFGILRVEPAGPCEWTTSWSSEEDPENPAVGPLIGNPDAPARELAAAAVGGVPLGVRFRVEVYDEDRRLRGVGSAIDRALEGWQDTVDADAGAAHNDAGDGEMRRGRC